MVKHTQTLCIEILLWLRLTILLGWRLKGYVIASMIKSRYILSKKNFTNSRLFLELWICLFDIFGLTIFRDLFTEFAFKW